MTARARAGSPARAPTAPAGRARAALPPALAVASALMAVLAFAYRDALTIPFINDDFTFLEKVARTRFAALASLERLAFNWYRPWSRELHYWTLERAFGLDPRPFHVASLALWLATMLAIFTLARGIVGARAATVAIAGLALSAAWAVPILWVAGVQDLWMLLGFALALLALARGHDRWASAACVLALLSKETAAVLPAVAALYLVLIERRPAREAARRTLPMWIALAAWAAIHPALGGRLWRPIAPAPPGLHPPVASIALRTVLGLVNLDTRPAPLAGWGSALARAAPLALVFGALVAWSARRPDDAPPATEPRRVATFGWGWAALAWTPLLLPGLGWHAYYALLGSIGAWLALAPALARRPAAAIALVAALAILGAARADTPSSRDDWGSGWYLRRAASFLTFMRDDLTRQLPAPPAHARLYFLGVPSNVGFMTGDGPSLRVWYRDTTLSGGLFGDYVARPAPAGPDYFFRYDSTAGWVAILPGAAPAAGAPVARWAADQRELAAAFARADDWGRAARVHAALATVFPGDAERTIDAGVSAEMAGDSGAAAGWYARAAAAPRAPDSTRAAARRFLIELRRK